jgi:hypothetical protein
VALFGDEESKSDAEKTLKLGRRFERVSGGVLEKEQERVALGKLVNTASDEDLEERNLKRGAIVAIRE